MVSDIALSSRFRHPSAKEGKGLDVGVEGDGRRATGDRRQGESVHFYGLFPDHAHRKPGRLKYDAEEAE